jgi:hypothetical protein
MEKSFPEHTGFFAGYNSKNGNSKYFWLPALIMLLLVPLSSCRELYDPETDSMDNVLIVDGLVTDEPGMSYIKLYYNKNSSLELLRNANVYLSDNHGSITPFHFSGSGKYLPHATFAGEAGRTYILNIGTEDEIIYQSDPQLILPSATLDSVYPKHAHKDYLFPDSYGNYIRRREAGFEVYADLAGENGSPLRFRVAPTLLLLYNWTEILDGLPPPVIIHYRWKKTKLSNLPDINLDRFDDGLEKINIHLISFIPSGKYNYQLEQEEHINKYIIIIRYYTLNNESYRFHEKAYRQVTSENKLFDPVASQLPTNIKCTSNPGLAVAGFFEASSTRTETYMLNYYLAGNIFHFTRIDDMENIPVSGSLKNQRPPFWQD